MSKQTPKGCPCCGVKLEYHPSPWDCWDHPSVSKETCPIEELSLRPRDIAAWNRRAADETLALRAAEIAAGLMWHEMRHGEMSSNCKRLATEAVAKAKAELAKEPADAN